MTELLIDISIGYASHDAGTVNLYLEESYSFRVLEPDAAIALRRGDLVEAVTKLKNEDDVKTLASGIVVLTYRAAV